MSEPPRSLFRKRPRPQLEAAAAAAPSQALAAPTPAEPAEPPPAKLAQVQAAWPSRPPSRPEASTAASSSDASAQPTAGPALTAQDVGFYVRREKVVTNYKEEGICQLFEWQAAALAQPGVLDDGANPRVHRADQRWEDAGRRDADAAPAGGGWRARQARLRRAVQGDRRREGAPLRARAQGHEDQGGGLLRRAGHAARAAQAQRARVHHGEGGRGRAEHGDGRAAGRAGP